DLITNRLNFGLVRNSDSRSDAARVASATLRLRAIWRALAVARDTNLRTSGLPEIGISRWPRAPVQRLFHDELGFDAESRRQLAEAAVGAPPPAVILEPAQQAARNHAKAAGLADHEAGVLAHRPPEGRERKRLAMAPRPAAPQESVEPRDDVPPCQVQRRGKDRDADDRSSSPLPDPPHGRYCGVDLVQMLPHLLADHDIGDVGPDRGIAVHKIADEELVIRLFLMNLGAEIGSRDGQLLEMRLIREMEELGSDAAADDEQAQLFAVDGRCPVADVLSQGVVT